MLSNFENTVYFETVISMPGIYSILKKKKVSENAGKDGGIYTHSVRHFFQN